MSDSERKRLRDDEDKDTAAQPPPDVDEPPPEPKRRRRRRSGWDKPSEAAEKAAALAVQAGAAVPPTLTAEQAKALEAARTMAAQTITQAQSQASSLTPEQAKALEAAKAMAAQTQTTLLASLQAQHLASFPMMQQHALAGQVAPTSLMQHQAAHTHMMLQRVAAYACRLYVGNIAYEVAEADIRAAFEPYGTIKTITFTPDPATGHAHKGFCFVEYTAPGAAAAALAAMQSFPMGGRFLKVSRPNTNVPAGMDGAMLAMVNGFVPGPAGTFTPAVPVSGQGILGNGGDLSALNSAAAVIPAKMHQRDKDCTIYIGSISYLITEDDIKRVFCAFGGVKSFVLQPAPEDPTRHKGFGFLEFTTQEAAAEAIIHMDNFLLGDRHLKVGRANSAAAPLVATNTLEGTTGDDEDEGPTGILSKPTTITPLGMGSGHVPRKTSPRDGPKPKRSAMAKYADAQRTAARINAQAGARAHALAAAAERAQPGSAAAAAANGGGGDSLAMEESLHIGGSQRYLIMQRLAQADGKVTSRCVLLENMVGPEEVDAQLEQEVTDECSKYGIVLRLVVYEERQSEETNDIVVKIFVLFDRSEAAVAAKGALDGRWFGGRKVRASYYSEDDFNELTAGT